MKENNNRTRSFVIKVLKHLKVLCLTLAVGICMKAAAQYDAAFNHYWTLQSFYNPAAAGLKNQLDVQAAYSMQMMGYTHAPATMVITADTVVVLDDEILGKPVDDDDARRILHKLSGKTHQVITGVCLTSLDKQRVFAVTTGVTFKQFTEQEIDYYVSHYHPLDKAGAYGIQEWIGHIGVTALNGSYFNVMGLPVQRIYMEMQDF